MEMPMPKVARRTGIVALVALAAGLVAAVLPRGEAPEAAEAREIASRLTLEQIPFHGARAYEYLQAICAIGPRVSGTPGMAAQQKLLEAHFTKLGGKVEYQRFRVRHPRTGAPVPMANLIVRWHPERKERILLCAHYDTRPIPDRDPNPANRREGVFLGANDGASGAALLMELAHHMPDLETKYGIDFCLFDGEELVYDNRRDPYCLGSEWFARQYAAKRPPYRYRWGVLLDMVGDADLQLYQEKNSMFWPDTRPLVLDILKTADRLGVKEFIPRRKHEVIDDHLKLRNIGGIPTCDIIDFDYPHWHTARDTPERCSALSLAKVGWVLHEWLKTVE
jgi:hypothetical protein